MSFLKIAHRGASGAFPENTMLAFRKAIEMGANAIELDVHACKSGEAVVIHDETLNRTTTGRGKVSDFTLDELSKFDAGQGERIPALAEVLSTFAEHITIFVEVKAEAAAISTGAVIADLATRGIPYAHMPVIGFYPDVLLAMKQKNPHIVIGASPDDTRPVPRGYCSWAKEKGFFSINPSFRQITDVLMTDAKSFQLRVFPWTVNNAKDIERMKMLRVDGIIGDYPDRL